MAEPDYYKILQIDPGAELEVIEAAYRRLARKYHPDVNKGPDAVQRMQQINVAYEVLRDPAKRAEYDRARLRRPFYRPTESPRYTRPPRPARKPPILDVHPLHLDFGHLPAGETQTKTLHLTNRGGGTLGGNLEKTASWLQLNITKVHSNFTIVEVTVDTTDLPPTFYRERIEITSNGGRESVEVTLRVTAPTEPRPAAVPAEHVEAAQVFPSFWRWWFSPSWTLPARLLVFVLQTGIGLLSFLAIAYLVVKAFVLQPGDVGLIVFFTFPILLSPLLLCIANLRLIYKVFTDEREERHWLKPIARVASMMAGAGVWCMIVLCAVVVGTDPVLHTIASSAATPTATRSVPTATPPPPTDTLTSVPTPIPPTPTATLTPVLPPTVAEAGHVWVNPIDRAEMVYVPAGEFIMGSSDTEVDSALALCNEVRSDCKRDWFEGEQPQHRVYLNAFYIDRTEVTNVQYRKCVEAGACEEPWCWDLSEFNTPDQPVVCVDWYQARGYCDWTGTRLPTEAEWEKAARGTDGRTYPWGNDFDCRKGNSDDEQELTDYVVPGGPNCDGYIYTAPVGSFPTGASPYGALDMAGNVLEWVADWYDEGYYSQSPVRDPLGPDSGTLKLLRGGSWYDGSGHARSASRLGYDPGVQYIYVGFRCARGFE